MTPAARIQAAVEILDKALPGAPVEQVLSNWSRASRFAGSKDRLAIRDLVFDGLRCRRSFAARGGSDTGRGVMLGALRTTAVDPATLFTGERHAPASLSAEEMVAGHVPAPGSAEALDCPDWMMPLFREALGDCTEPVLLRLRERAPVHLRVNLRKTTREQAMLALEREGIPVRPHELSPAALEIVDNARALRSSRLYLDGEVELQDAGSQAIADFVNLPEGGSLLDYCAGGGGKTLAVAGRVGGRFVAHDAEWRRMKDIPERAARAGIEVICGRTEQLSRLGPFHTVLVDAPCSGSGSWRRNPQGKWAMTPERLADLTVTQASVLSTAARCVAPGGELVYATCSLFTSENGGQISDFLRGRAEWRLSDARQITPLDNADGFYMARLTRLA